VVEHEQGDYAAAERDYREALRIAKKSESPPAKPEASMLNRSKR
jgi:hypothetical protein